MRPPRGELGAVEMAATLEPVSDHPLWMVAGAALLGTVLGGAAVYLGLSDRHAAEIRDVEEHARAAVDPPAAAEIPDPQQAAPAPELEAVRVDPPAPPATLEDAVAATRGAVVTVQVDGRIAGAGVIFDARGLVFTNYHVVEPLLRSTSLRQSTATLTVRFDNGRELPARVVAGDASEDVAVLRLEQSSPDEVFLAAEIGSSSELRVGEAVFAVGSPVGLEHTVSTGIVSAMDRTGILSNRDLPLVQLDAAINLGNSGGPLFNLRGELVGITTARSNRAEGIGFALPIDRVRAFLQALARGENERVGVIGIEMDPRRDVLADIEDFGYRAGIYVSDVPEGPARAGGMRVGDVVVEIRGRRYDELGTSTDARVKMGRQLGRVVRSLLPGETLELTVVRAAKTRTLQLEVAAASPQLQTLVDVERTFGLVLEADDGLWVTSISPDSKLSRYRDARGLVGMRVSHVMGRRTDSVDDLAEVVRDVKAGRRRGQVRQVAVSFRSRDGKRWDVAGFPLSGVDSPR